MDSENTTPDQAPFVAALSDGFVAGAKGLLGNPALASRELRMTWRNGWMAGRKQWARTTDGASEHNQQVVVFAWLDLMTPLLPDLALAFAVPNAAKRSPRLGAYMKSEGLKAGMVDIVVPVPAMGQGGLFIELKTAKGRLSPEQKDWLYRLEAVGNRAVMCRGWEEAVRTIQAYMEGVLG